MQEVFSKLSVLPYVHLPREIILLISYYKRINEPAHCNSLECLFVFRLV
jgi:hypothetical protein